MTAINRVASPWSRFPIPNWGLERGCRDMYDTERYLPKYEGKLGLPIFLTRP